VAGQPLAFQMPLAPLQRGVYTVHWRVDSAVDGHATEGAYQFGVGVAPSQGAIAERGSTSVSSPLEVGARWLLLVGLVAVLGGATAAAARLGGTSGADIKLAAGGWVVALIGLLMLTEAQRRNAGSSLGALLQSTVGHALIWRAVAIAVASVALLVAARRTAARRVALLVCGLAALGAIVVHVANGHADASRWPSALTVTLQVAHFAVAGVWIGGLAALLIGVRGAASDEKSAAVRRFSTIAAVGLAVVVVTGSLRAVSELHSVDQLVSTEYGRAVLAKLILVGLIAAIAARSRRRGVPAAATDLRPLRRSSRIELSLGVVALLVAALLGTLAPPLSIASGGLRGLSASGGDVDKTVHVHLTTLSDQPGPNRFTAQIDDTRSGSALRGANVTLLFTPLDDPGVRSSSLGLSPAPNGSYVASGPNLTFDGRWGVRVLVGAAGKTVEVPLELDPIGPEQQLSVERIPGRPPTYSHLVGLNDVIRISPNPEHAGPSKLSVVIYQLALGSEESIDHLVVTQQADRGPVAQQPVQRVSQGSFVSDLVLPAGHVEIAVIAHRHDGTRLRSVFDLNVPGG
jgi:copper transport protein